MLLCSESSTHRPTEQLAVSGKTWEAQVNSLVTSFESLNFKVLSFTRVPYLCEGDLEHSFYRLDDAVFVLAPTQHDADTTCTHEPE